MKNYQLWATVTVPKTDTGALAKKAKVWVLNRVREIGKLVL